MNGPPVWASDYIGIPYSDRGHSHAGAHCWGLVWLVYRERLGIDLHRDDTISGADLTLFGQEISERIGEWRQIVDGAQDFDLVIMSAIVRCDGRLRRVEAHSGVVAGDYVLHVERGSDAVCQPVSALNRRIVGIYRYDSAILA